MRRYVMTRRLAGGVSVVVTGGAGVAYDLPHLVRHSPDGFEWGYHGSGPAELARSIAGDVTGEEVLAIVARLVSAGRIRPEVAP